MKHLIFNKETGKYQCQYNPECNIPELDTVTGSSCLTCKIKENETQRQT